LSSSTPNAVTSSDLANEIAKFAIDKKADNVISINVKELTSFTDQFVICSADTDIQVKAIADSIRRSTNHKPVRIEGYEQLNWVLLDYIDVIVHVFKTTERNYYNIEKLWADAPKIEYNDENFISIKSNSD
jgi:ribosome-associated protein|tara:strand:- start:1568 stop:1960 length:393 start_codon:yes stop_codon:yes gene_type:complete